VGVNGVEYQTGVFHKFKKNTATFLTIDSSGNVGVSESVPKATVHVKPAGNGWIDGLLLEHNAGNTGWNIHAEDNSTNDLWFGYNSNTSEPIGSQAASAKLKIDSAGNSTFTGKVIAENSTSQQIEIGDGAGSSWDFGRNTTSGSLVIRQNATEKLAVSSTGLAVTGNITAPTNPAFNVGLSATQSNIAINGWVTVLFDTESFDQGANFNTGTYTFTAPVTGKYQLNVNLRLDNIDTAANYYQIAIATSNKTYYFTVDVGVLASDPTYWEVPLSVLADMDASDTAYVKIWQAGGTAQTDVNADLGETTFSGYLAC
jgi:hypothetical protein